MEWQILTFIGVACVAIAMNAGIALGAWYVFTRLTTKLELTLTEFEKNSEPRQWLDSMQAASENAVAVTQATKEWMAEVEPRMAKAQETYTRTLSEADIKLEEVANTINTSADKMKEAVEGPATSVMAFAVGVTKAVESMKGGGE